MTRAIRVCLVDDSPFVCQLLAGHLRSAEGFEVVGVAHDGITAVGMIRDRKPDVIALDVEMPGASGIEVLKRVMSEFPTPTLMVSGVSRHAARVTLEAFQLGAVDFILKYTPGLDTDPDAFRRDFVSKVRTVASVKVIRNVGGVGAKKNPFENAAKKLVKPKASPAFSAVAKLERNTAKNGAKDKTREKTNEAAQTRRPTRQLAFKRVLVIGASTGGPSALRDLFSTIPNDFPYAVVIVQHMPAAFTEVLAAQLNRQSPLTVRQASHGDVLEAGTVFVAPGEQHLLVGADGVLEVASGPKIRGYRPSIDVTMQSAAQAFQGDTTGVLLTGMGDDGVAGMAFIRRRGGQTLVQDEATSVVFGMPLRAIEKKIVDFVGSPHRIAEKLCSLAGVSPRAPEVDEEELNPSLVASNQLRSSQPMALP